MNGTDKVRVMRVESTAISIRNFRHGIKHYYLTYKKLEVFKGEKQ
jgi:hypothetical protein